VYFVIHHSNAKYSTTGHLSINNFELAQKIQHQKVASLLCTNFENRSIFGKITTTAWCLRFFWLTL